MKKLLIAIGVVAAVVAVVYLVVGREDDDAYLVRAIFDNGSFLVEGEEVRVGGATVGSIESVGVTMPDEIDSYEDGQPQAIPGKAVMVMKIDDEGFQDFRRDASCIVRPQSLIGEKFIDCRPTVPRAPGSEPPPPLRVIPEGEPGAGQHLLPVENNSSTVDPDLINNINKLPYVQRFRLILNELGAGLAGRGEDLAVVIKRANPVLRDVDRLLGTLNSQRDRLAQLSADSHEILAALARERTSVADFFANSGAAAQASAERGASLEASFRKLPEFLREFRKTMRSFQGFSDAAAPVFADFDRANPAFTRATQALAPFLDASTVSLKSLGATGEVAGPIFNAADPVVRKARDLGKSGASPTTKLAKFLGSVKKTGGWDGLVDLIYNSAAATNEFDQYGHFQRVLVTLTNCTDYRIGPKSGCSANFNGLNAGISSVFDPAAFLSRIQEELAEQGGGTAAGLTEIPPLPPAISDAQPQDPPSLGEGEELEPEPAEESAGASRDLLDLLLGR